MPKQIRSTTPHRAADDAPTRSPARSYARWPEILLLAVTLLVYAGTLGHQALNWDDPEYVSNSLYAEPDALVRIWASFETPQVYPVVFTSFWLEQRVWGTRMFGYHLDQVVLHVVAVWLALRFLQRLGVPRWVALCTAALFALHPTQVATVAWLAERKNVLAAIFAFAGLTAYLGWRETRRPREWLLVLAFFLLAMLSKSTAVTLPVSLVLLEATIPGTRRMRWAALLPFFLPALVMSALTVMREHGAEITSDVSVLDRVWIAAAGRVHDVWRLLVPFGLSPLYPRWPVEAARPFGIAAFVVGVSALLWIFRARARWPWVAFGVTQFVISLVPTSGLIPFGYMDHSFVADHFLYWPSWGFWLASLASVASFAPTATFPRFALWIPLVWILPSLALVPLHARAYRDSGRFWGEVLRHNPNSWVAHGNLGHWYAERGEFAEAKGALERSLALHPRNPDAAFNLGYAHDRLGEWTKATEAYERALGLDPTYPGARENLRRVRGIQERREYESGGGR